MRPLFMVVLTAKQISNIAAVLLNVSSTGRPCWEGTPTYQEYSSSKLVFAPSRWQMFWRQSALSTPNWLDNWEADQDAAQRTLRAHSSLVRGRLTLSRPNASQYLKSRPISQLEEACSLETLQKCCISGHNASHYLGAVSSSFKQTEEKSESPRKSRRVRVFGALARPFSRG